MPSKVETEMAVIAAAMSATDYTFYGSSEEARHGAPPKITWVEDEDETFEAPSQQQQRSAETCAIRRVPIDIHVWGESIADSETKYEALIAALVTTYTRHAFELRPSRKKGESKTAKGHKRILSVYMKVPVQRAALTTGAVDTAAATGKASNDGGATYETGVTQPAP